MAISFVGSVAGSTGSADETVNFSSLVDSSGATPTLQQNDIVIVTMCRRATSNTASLVTSTGYAEVYSNVYSNSSDDSNLISYYKVMGATPDTSVVLTTTGFSNTQAYCVHVFRGVDTTSPFDGVTPTTATQTGAVGPDAPAITPTTSGAWICAAGGGAGTSAGNMNPLTNPANMSSTTNHFATGTNTRAEVALALKTDWASGAFDPNAFGGGGTASGNGLSAATFVLKPAATGGSTVTGALAATESGSDTFAGAGTVKVQGSIAASESGSDTASLSGSVKVQGSLSASEAGSDTFAGSGGGIVSGSLSATEAGSDIASLSGSVLVTGDLAAAEAGADTASLAGTVAEPLSEITGAMAATEAGDDFARFAAIIDNAFLRYRRRRRGAPVISGR